MFFKSKETWDDYLFKGVYISETGQVLTYNYDGQTIYRYIPEPYTYYGDAFYADSNLQTLLARRSNNIDF